MSPPNLTPPRLFLASLSLLSLTLIATYPYNHGLQFIDGITASLKLPDGNALRDHYTGIRAVDDGQKLLVASFWPVTRSLEGRALNVELLGLLMVAYAVWTVEMGRGGRWWV